MILIAPDKFKGTLTAVEACDIIADALSRKDVVKAPMADGGEGTADVIRSAGRLPGLGRPCDWVSCDGYFLESGSRTAVIDSSSVIGLQLVAPEYRDVLHASSKPLGVKVRKILDGGCERVIIGVGGTATCDGGTGFLEGLGIGCLDRYRYRLVGLCDVRVPLLPECDDGPSALMFAPQKGASVSDIQVLRDRLDKVQLMFGTGHSPFDGAGGGLGYALASVIGAECHSGADYVLGCYDIDWQAVDMVITGEGCIDCQTAQGKVVDAVTKAARIRGIPVIAIGGIADPAMKSGCVLSTADYYPDLPLNKETAALRLRKTVENLF